MELLLLLELKKHIWDLVGLGQKKEEVKNYKGQTKEQEIDGGSLFTFHFCYLFSTSFWLAAFEAMELRGGIFLCMAFCFGISCISLISASLWIFLCTCFWYVDFCEIECFCFSLFFGGVCMYFIIQRGMVGRVCHFRFKGVFGYRYLGVLRDKNIKGFHVHKSGAQCDTRYPTDNAHNTKIFNIGKP